MHYLSVEQGHRAPGLRLVLTKGVPGPWGESAKAIFGMKGLRFAAVAQEGGGENRELREWTGQSAAPVAIYENELPLSDSIDILFLAERLQPEPRLVPTDIDARATMFGIAREIIGRDGIGWNRRIMMLAPMLERGDPPAAIRRLAERYGCSPEAAHAAEDKVLRILDFLARLLERQQARGSDYLVGDSVSAADIYWACFANMLSPMPHEQCPMPEAVRTSYGDVSEAVRRALEPALLAHREMMFARHLALPLDFLPDQEPVRG